MDLTHLLLLLLGLAIGVAAGLLLAPPRGPDATAVADLIEGRTRESGAVAAGNLAAERHAVEGMVSPLRDTLGRVEGQLRDLELARLEGYSRLTEQVELSRATSTELRGETAALVRALSAPQSRGRWGEVQLRRVVELAGMVEHCDFDEQPSVVTSVGVLRPDLVVRLAGGKRIVVDAKVSLAAYLAAADGATDEERADRMRAHARHLRKHVDDLASKAYWAAFSAAPEFVVLFVPGESFLGPALQHDPALLEYAMTRRVMIATPTTLMAMLRTVAYAWQQEALTDNAREVFELGRELYERLGTLGEHMDKLGRSVGRVVGDYNRVVGSMEGRVLVTARRIQDLKLVDSELVPPRAVEEGVRPLSAAELLDDVDRGERERAPLRALPDG